MGAFAFPDGNTNIYFNVCGDLAHLTESPCRGSPAGLCATQNDQEGTQVNGGMANTAVFSDYVRALEAGRAGVTLTYTHGDVCPASPSATTVKHWSTELNLLCPEAESVGLAVSSFAPSARDPCVIQLNLTSIFACPIADPAETIWVPVVSWVLAFLATLLCCAACCACTRRCRARKCQRAAQAVHTSPADDEMAVVPLEGATPSAPVITPENVQYFYPPIPHFYADANQTFQQPMMASMYPYAAPPQASAPANNVVAMGAIRTPVRSADNTRTVTDEQIARALQAQYDNEASYL